MNTSNFNSKSISRVILIVLDSVGIGALPDADEYGDQGANTLGNIAQNIGGLHLPEMEKLGLGKIKEIEGLNNKIQVEGAYGKMAEASVGKDTTTGHWELSGIITSKPFPVYPDGFPEEIIEQIEYDIGKEVLGNRPASGTKIIEELGVEHMKSGKPIVYTSADSVFQIAAHENVIPVTELYQICKRTRKILQGEHGVARVIARPFIGSPGNFERTENRKDFSLQPPEPTLLDKVKNSGLKVQGVGKIEDIFAGQGLSESKHTVDNMETVDALLQFLQQDDRGLIFANLVEFDMNYGHRRNVKGYARALKNFDNRIPEIKSQLETDEILIITADHGCDPTHEGTDHTREYVPLLIFGDLIKKDYKLEIRDSFADLAATITDFLNVKSPQAGESFATQLFKDNIIS